MAETRSVVVIGGGIIGCTTAYYLTRHPSFLSASTKVIILEASAHGAAQGASGKAGGVVARWAYPKPHVDISFNEHVRLAELHDGAERWGWRYVGCGSWEGRTESVPHTTSATDDEVDSSLAGRWKSLEKTLGLDGGKPQTNKKQKVTRLPKDLDWIPEDLTDAYSPMAPPGDTAQVHPHRFTTSMLTLAQEKGAEFIHGKATRIAIEDGRVTGVEYDSPGSTQHLPATYVVLAAGAWASDLLPTLPIAGTRAHSIPIHPPKELLPIAPYVLFTEIARPEGNNAVQRTQAQRLFYARPGPDGEVYACGPGNNAPLPGYVDEVVVDQEACGDVWMQVGGVSRVLRAGTVNRR